MYHHTKHVSRLKSYRWGCEGRNDEMATLPAVIVVTAARSNRRPTAGHVTPGRPHRVLLPRFRWVIIWYLSLIPSVHKTHTFATCTRTRVHRVFGTRRPRLAQSGVGRRPVRSRPLLHSTAVVARSITAAMAPELQQVSPIITVTRARQLLSYEL